MRAGARYERRTASGKFIEFTFKPLDDGSLLAIYRDITELKEREEAAEASRADLERTSSVLQMIVHRDITELKHREEALAAAKEAADAARRDVERGRAVMQAVLDNMSDGVMLLGEDMHAEVRQSAAQRNHQRLHADIAHPGVAARRPACATRRSAAISDR